MDKKDKKSGVSIDKLVGPLNFKDYSPEDFIKNLMINPINKKENSFAVIAIRCNSESSTGKRKMAAGVTYNLLKGYIIEENRIKCTKKQKTQNTLYDDFYFESTNDIPHIQISAIVGQNGSGKSSIVEFLMRLINNFAASTIGEYATSNAAERLHYIDGIDGELWYILDNNAYHLKIKNVSVKLTIYERKDNKDDETIYSNEKLVFDNELDADIKKLKDIHKSLDEENLKKTYKSFFYTLVSNQSIYAYNSYDFKKECNSNRKEAIANNKNERSLFDIEDRCWLHGLFHKNDAYRTPLVITPYRYKGNIDINNEKDLAIERLVYLYTFRSELRKINDHLFVEGLRYIYEPGTNYGFKRIVSRLNYKNITIDGYEFLRKEIVSLWGKKLNKDIFSRSNKPYYEEAVDYLVYKTLKISLQYKEHRNFYDATFQMTDSCDIELLKSYIDSLAEDNSHITRKLWQCLAYLIYDVYVLPETSKKRVRKKISQEITFEDLPKKWVDGAEMRNRDNLTTTLNNVRSQAIFPPPFARKDITLCLIQDTKTKIDFESLSSGEKQQIFSVSSLLYHLDNLESAHKDDSDSNRIKYNNVCVVLEEIELYYHPELQQQFIYYFLNALNQIHFEHIKCIHLIIVTHSPYLLSDIPKSNVLALKKNSDKPINDLQTFGANIHDMLKDSFFLEGGALGLFAQWEVGHLMACMKIYQWAQNAKDKSICPYLENKDAFSFLERYTYWGKFGKQTSSKLFSFEHFSEDLSPILIKERIQMIDEPVLFHVLKEEYNRTFPSMTEELKELKKTELLKQLQELDK